MQHREEFRPGATIIKQGDEGVGFYILEKGSVEVYKDDIKLNVLMFPGTIFGEMGNITNKPRTCTVKARTPTVVTRYEAAGMDEIIREYPDIALRIFMTLASRLERTTQKLADLSQAALLISEEE